MTRFWATAGIVVGTVMGALLCGYLMVKSFAIDPQGQWFGRWPLSGADNCRSKLYPDGRFEMECQGKEKYATTGRWLREGNTIRFDFNLFVRNGIQVKDPKKMVLRTDGTSNVMYVGLVEERGEPHRWRRAAP